MADIESVATVNGKTVTVKKWIAYLTIIALVLSLMGTVFGNVIEPVVWKTSIENTVEQNTKRVDKVEAWQEQHAKQTVLQNEVTTKQLHELQLNLKVFMRKNGLNYESISE